MRSKVSLPYLLLLKVCRSHRALPEHGSAENNGGQQTWRSHGGALCRLDLISKTDTDFLVLLVVGQASR